MKTCAIVVLYHPNVSNLLIQMKGISSQVSQILIVSNGDSGVFEALKSAEFKNYEYIALGKNLGIAEAQSRGIAEARKHQATHILLLDQDTALPENYVQSCLNLEQELIYQGIPVGSIGARYLQSGKTRKNDKYQEVDALIASGQLIRLEVLNEVGDMNSALFLDAVDDEWSARAQFKGYRLFINSDPAMKIRHELGYARKVFFGLWTLRYHQPSRYYTMFRNYGYLMAQPYVPWRLKGHYLGRLIKLFAKALIVPERKQYFLEMVRGLKAIKHLGAERAC